VLGSEGLVLEGGRRFARAAEQDLG